MSNAGFNWNIGRCNLRRGDVPLLMGILNVTPDSFSDGSRHNSHAAAVEHGIRLADEGADIIDVGGESTRPGALPVSLEEELQRTIPVIRSLRQRISTPISIDTMKSEVARQAIDAGADIINDVSALTHDIEMLDVAAAGRAGVCLMHMQGTPQTMQATPQYGNVVQEVTDYLCDRVSVCITAGICRDRVCVDPGIGFGKTFEHNVALLKATPFIRAQTGCAILVGHSRKRFLSKLLGRSLDERLAGTIGVSVALAQLGADLLRVHDVQLVRDALLAWSVIDADAQD